MKIRIGGHLVGVSGLWKCDSWIINPLGAGGAARAIGVELALAGAKEIIVINRDAEKGLDLSNHIGYNTAAHSSFYPWNSQIQIREETDVLVNATTIGLFPDENVPAMDWEGIKEGMTVCDVIPNPPDTGFLQQARASGAQTIDGLGMLVHQGTIGFTWWTGETAPVGEMKEALRGVFG